MVQKYMRGDATRMERYIDLGAVVYEFKHDVIVYFTSKVVGQTRPPSCYTTSCYRAIEPAAARWPAGPVPLLLGLRVVRAAPIHRSTVASL